MGIPKHLWRGLLPVVLLLLPFGLSAQRVQNIRINEVLVVNHDNLIDAYGHRVGWIELHNTGHSSVDLGGCYLTVWRDGQGTMYPIPKGDPGTVLPPEGYVVFYAEGTATKGVFHTNFTLDQTGYLALYDQSGRTLIDAVDYSVADQQPDVSIGFRRDAAGDFTESYPLAATTPDASNEERDVVPRSERFRERDPHGAVMAVTAMAVVFSALIVLYLVFRTIGKINVRAVRRKQAQDAQFKNQQIHPVMPAEGEVIHGAELAAIALALYRYQNDLHDIESNVITINKVARAYSPWSSKIYGLRQFPNKR